MTELERRRQAVLEALATDSWTDPKEPVKALAALGLEAEPVFLELLASPLPLAEINALEGLQQLGPGVSDAAALAVEALVVKRLPGDCDWAGFALETLRPERFWALRAHTRLAVEMIMDRKRLPDGTAGEFLERLLAAGDERALCTALGRVHTLVEKPRALVDAVRRVLLSSHREARAMALHDLTRLPDGAPAEALIEAMVTSAPFRPLLERVAWHPDSALLFHRAVGNRDLVELGVLLERRRCAGLSNASDEVLELLVTATRNPWRTGDYRRSDMPALARCLANLGGATALELLVEAVVNEVLGAAALTDALRDFGAEAVRALEAQLGSSKLDPLARTRVLEQLDTLATPAPSALEAGDAAFIAGDIDLPKGGAFQHYASALRRGAGAHAAFQLAWIDRAFGVPISDDRVRWIRSLGFRDETLLEWLGLPTRGLPGERREWTTCSKPKVRELLELGLPGVAFRGSQDPRHRADAEAHVALVRHATR